MYNKIPIIISLFIFFSPFASAQVETSVVVPNSLTDTEGPDQLGFPINCNPGALPDGIRYQQVYLNSQISQNGGVVEIVGINFRSAEEEPENPPVIIPQFQIDMSITQAEPDNLSLTFANNLGLIVTTVYSGPLTVSTPQCGAGPCPFSLRIPLQTPFMYDSSEGNLIIDVKRPICGLTSITLDASQASEDLDNTSNAFTSNGGSVNDPDAFLANNSGLVTEFDIILPPPVVTPIPTLSEWSLIVMAGILGIIGYMVIRRRKAAA